MKIILTGLTIFIMSVNIAFTQKPEETEDWSRRPEIVAPGKNNAPPGDAVILYKEKSDAGKWMHRDGSPIQWLAEEALTVRPSAGDIFTRDSFGDCQLHVEWRTPATITGEGQGRGNSGIYLMGLYEVQVLDSYNNETYYNGQAGSIYKQYIPLVNASLPPGEWQTYDIFFTSPVFNPDRSMQEPAYVTVVHNGILIQNHVALKGPTLFIGRPAYKYHEKRLPLMLQEHSNPISYRNIWIREI